jgi:hypothetical protein
MDGAAFICISNRGDRRRAGLGRFLINTARTDGGQLCIYEAQAKV